jgi:hypothetical protein
MVLKNVLFQSKKESLEIAIEEDKVRCGGKNGGI